MSHPQNTPANWQFNDRILSLVGIPVASVVISILLFHEQYAAGNWSYIWMCQLLSLLYTALYWLSIRWGYRHIARWYPRVEDIAKRLLLAAAWLGVVFLSVGYGVQFLLTLLHIEQGKSDSILMEIVATMLLTSLIISIYEATSYHKLLAITLMEKAVLEQQHVESELAGLRHQVNPHFLFNSLNTLACLIPEDQERAVHFVQKLSKVYRYVLEHRDAALIPLRDELTYMEAYSHLMKERFGENLQVVIGDLAPWLQSPVAPLTLQLLFENAVKHNVISNEKPLKIEIFGEKDYLIVRNNLQLKNQQMESTGTGLNNIRERYRLLLNAPVEIIQNDQHYTVRIPLSAHDTP